MKKYLAILLVFSMVFAFAACGTEASTITEDTAATEETAQTEEAAEPEGEQTEEAAAEETAEPEAETMTYAEYAAAELDSEVTVRCYVQSKQTWWDNTITVYAQDEDGAYFIYNMACTEADYDLLVPGTCLIVTGYKSEWSGEIEIADATFVIDDGSYIAEPTDVTALLGTAELEQYQNMYVSFNSMKVEAISYKDGQPGDDIYVTLSKDGISYEFCVEAYNWTTTPDSELYAAVGELQNGDYVNATGFLYWYNGANTHITGIEKTGDPSVKSEGTMTYADYTSAAVDDEVVIEAYVQNTQTWWDNSVTIYAQDPDGAYFIYNAACTEDDYAKLIPGQKIRVTGYKSEWSGEIEIADATFELVDDGTSYIAAPVDVTACSPDMLADYMNMYVSFTDMTVDAISYKNNEPGDDIYLTLSKDGVSLEFCVEAYCATTTADSALYAEIGELQTGDTVDVCGYLYWYEGADTHITVVTVK